MPQLLTVPLSDSFLVPIRTVLSEMLARLAARHAPPLVRLGVQGSHVVDGDLAGLPEAFDGPAAVAPDARVVQRLLAARGRVLEAPREGRALAVVAEVLPGPLVEAVQSVLGATAAVVGGDGGGVEGPARRPLALGPEEKHPGVSGC